MVEVGATVKNFKVGDKVVAYIVVSVIFLFFYIVPLFLIITPLRLLEAAKPNLNLKPMDCLWKNHIVLDKFCLVSSVFNINQFLIQLLKITHPSFASFVTFFSIQKDNALGTGHL